MDIKAAGGYPVAPPSIHPNGWRYEAEKSLYPAQVPSRLLEELTRKADEPPALAVDFQERRAVPFIGSSATTIRCSATMYAFTRAPGCARLRALAKPE